MRLGYELVKEQLFFRRELIDRLPWLIRVRWISLAAVTVGCLAMAFRRPSFPLLPLFWIIAAVAGYNLWFSLLWKRWQRDKPQHLQPFAVFGHVQISFDLVALFAAVYVSGGIFGPLALFFVFPVILAGILLPPPGSYLYTVMTIGALGVLTLLQQSHVIAAQPVLFGIHPPAGEAVVRYASLAVAILISGFLTANIKLSLRDKGRELLRVSKELEETNTRLTALYGMVKEMGACPDLQRLMDSATGRAARILGVKACSIKLLDEPSRKLHFASTFGLSQDYIAAKQSVDIEKSPINRKVLEGSVYAIGQIEEKDYFQYPEDIEKEGIASMICLPLRVEKMIIGVLCAYSDQTYRFSDDDVSFFSLMADLTALAIESMRSQVNRIWFLQKAAHQLRAPFQTVSSMLKVIRNGYVGEVTPQQVETIRRCERRIDILGSLISDLLTLSIRRTEMGPERFHPVHVVDAVQSLKEFFQAHAREKGIALSFLIEERLPPIQGTEQLLDELLSNLVSNALKYTPKGGAVRISLNRGAAGGVRLEVADTGIGISETDFPRLFSEFFRGEEARDLDESGTGLGLVIVKEIVDRFRGTISVQSQPGQGSTFICHLPAGT